jgi:hypothetical protein
MSYTYGKQIKGEKYIYLLMAYKLAKSNNGTMTVGRDTGMRGGQQFYRAFEIQNGDGYTILYERKNSPNFVSHTKTYEVTEYPDQEPTIRENVDQDGTNWSQEWSS